MDKETTMLIDQLEQLNRNLKETNGYLYSIEHNLVEVVFALSKK